MSPSPKFRTDDGDRQASNVEGDAALPAFSLVLMPRNSTEVNRLILSGTSLGQTFKWCRSGCSEIESCPLGTRAADRSKGRGLLIFHMENQWLSDEV